MISHPVIETLPSIPQSVVSHSLCCHPLRRHCASTPLYPPPPFYYYYYCVSHALCCHPHGYRPVIAIVVSHALGYQASRCEMCQNGANHRDLRFVSPPSKHLRFCRANYSINSMRPPMLLMFRGNNHTRGNIRNFSGTGLQSCGPCGAAGHPSPEPSGAGTNNHNLLLEILSRIQRQKGNP